MVYDVLQTDSYVMHLTALAKRHQIKTSEDILNQQGAVIIGKGHLLDESVTRRIVQHKLQKPLELSVSFEDGLDGETLLDLYHVMLSKHPAYAALHKKWSLEKYLQHACLLYGQYPLLIQKITVLKQQLPEIFIQGLYVAYGAMVLAQRMKKDETCVVNAFLAGLCHDIGMLHIAPDVIHKKHEYNPEDWRAMQSHTVIAQCILQHVAGLHPDIIQAVVEHHERCDGSGYPLGKKENTLSQLGQIVALADTCYALYLRELKPRGLGPEALLPVLQFYPDVHGAQVFESAMRILKQLNWPRERVYANEHIPGLVSGLLLRNEAIQHDYFVLYGVVTAVRHEKGFGLLNILSAMGERLNYALISSGLVQSEHCQWLVQVCGQKLEQDYPEIEQVDLMYAEIEWQLKQMQRMTYVLWKKHKFPDQHLHDLIQRGLLQIDHYHKLHATKPSMVS